MIASKFNISSNEISRGIIPVGKLHRPVNILWTEHEFWNIGRERSCGLWYHMHFGEWPKTVLSSTVLRIWGRLLQHSRGIYLPPEQDISKCGSRTAVTSFATPSMTQLFVILLLVPHGLSLKAFAGSLLSLLLFAD